MTGEGESVEQVALTPVFFRAGEGQSIGLVASLKSCNGRKHPVTRPAFEKRDAVFGDVQKDANLIDLAARF